MNHAVGGLDRNSSRVMSPVPTSRGTADECDFTNLSMPCSARTRPLFTSIANSLPSWGTTK